MESIEIEFRKNKLRDIQSIVFGADSQEILTTMEIILTMYLVDDDLEIINVCKSKLLEGLNLLKKGERRIKLSPFELDVVENKDTIF